MNCLLLSSSDDTRRDDGGDREGIPIFVGAGDREIVSGWPARALSVREVTNLARESPFKELATLEIVVAELKRPDQVWDV